MKIIKWLLVTVLVIVLFAVSSVFVIITFYKKELTDLLMQELKAKYGLVLKVEKINVSFLHNWPHAAVDLRNVVIESEITAGRSEPLIKAGSLSLSFNIERMLHKEFVVQYVSIRNAEIMLVKNEDGSKNFVFKKPAVSGPQPVTAVTVQDSTKDIQFDLSRVSIRRSRFSFINRQREQNVSIDLKKVDVDLKIYTDGIKAHMSGNVYVPGLLFNSRRGAFLANKDAELDLKLCYFNEGKSICVNPGSTAEIDKQKYKITSVINFGNIKRMALIVSADQVNYAKTTTLLTPKMQRVLSNFEVSRPVNGRVLLVVNIGQREEPIIIADFSGENNSMTIGNSKIPYSDVSFKGKIISLDSTRQRGDSENARILFSPVTGKIYDFPFVAAIRVTNLLDPQLLITGRLTVEGSKINFNVAKDFVLRGTTIAKIRYSGPAEKLNSREFLEKPMKLNATLTFKNMSYREVNRAHTYVINGDATLNNRDLKFEALNLKTVVGEATLKGKAEDFVNYILGYTNGFKANLAARTDLLNLNPLFKEPEPLPSFPDKDSKRQKEKKEKKKLKKKIEQANPQVVVPASKFEFNVQLFAKKLLIRSVVAQMVNADLYYKADLLNIKSLNLSTCDGKVFAKATVEDFNKVRADINVSNVNVNKLFTEFENFGQEAIVSENLKGILSLDAKFKTDLDSKMEIIGETMAGEVRLKLKEGHLLNFDPVQNLSNFLFKNRDFNDVSFSELNETFHIEGYKMEIHELEIASNVLDLYVVNGVYNFRGNSNINILIPWSNLKKRGKNYIPKNRGESSQDTKGLKLNFQGPNKKMKITMGHKTL